MKRGTLYPNALNLRKDKTTSRCREGSRADGRKDRQLDVHICRQLQPADVLDMVFQEPWNRNVALGVKTLPYHKS